MLPKLKGCEKADVLFKQLGSSLYTPSLKHGHRRTVSRGMKRDRLASLSSYHMWEVTHSHHANAELAPTCGSYRNPDRCPVISIATMPARAWWTCSVLSFVTLKVAFFSVAFSHCVAHQWTRKGGMQARLNTVGTAGIRAP